MMKITTSFIQTVHRSCQMHSIIMRLASLYNMRIGCVQALAADVKNLREMTNTDDRRHIQNCH